METQRGLESSKEGRRQEGSNSNRRRVWVGNSTGLKLMRSKGQSQSPLKPVLGSRNAYLACSMDMPA
eukprot:scaffold318843_cov12-Tisochrysis_lutea.AAC.1